MIDPEHASLSISKQCELIDLPRSSYYSYRSEQSFAVETEENLMLMRLIDEEYMRHPFLGSRKMKVYMRKRVQRLMRKMGIASVAPKPFTSLANKSHAVYPYLLSNMTTDHPGHVWSTDITYIRLKGGFVYLVAILDWYSRKVLSWEVSNTMESSFCISALERSIRIYGPPEIFNTDQGSQFTSEAFINLLKNNNIKISMDGKGRWVDNVFIERLWRSVKYENIYINEYVTVSELKAGLKVYFQYYNSDRSHQSLDYKTPNEVFTSVNKEAA